MVRQVGPYIYRWPYRDKIILINFATAAQNLQLSKDMIYRYGKRSRPKHDGFRRRRAVKQHFRARALRRALPAIWGYDELASQKVQPPYIGDIWMDGIEVMVAREKQGSPEGLYLAAKGGHNSESHNHNDVGSCIIFVDGLPGIIDVGVETYTRKTFSPQRYEIWTMQSQYHNLPTINGKMQLPGKQFCASNVEYSADNDEAALLAAFTKPILRMQRSAAITARIACVARKAKSNH